ncbi:MAG TPA: polysaccharide deacetylase family protein [Xanthobacteraceae bacterium]|jgi:peptidoglycan/xylan/chitin deacetylase (PgdA/CDA1 family)|nr:polysaccharide deacetylase family protein [Xanthobacteraceae bacterium]
MFRPLLEGVLRKGARHHRSKPFAMRNAAPLVSFTFDDVPASAYVNGAAILEQYELRGTFYIAAGICGTMDENEHWRVIDRGQVRGLHDRGHEIGCHTFSHVKVDTIDARQLNEECERNGKLLRELCPGIEVTNFCYPFGRVSLPRKLELQDRFDTCRGIYEGINSGTIDLALLRVIELYDRTLTPAKLKRTLREVREHNGWLIFYTHDVAEPPSWIGASPRLLREVIEAVQAEKIGCVTIRDALAAIGYRRPTPASADINARAASGWR